MQAVGISELLSIVVGGVCVPIFGSLGCSGVYVPMCKVKEFVAECVYL